MSCQIIRTTVSNSKAIEHDHNYCSEDSFRDKSTQTDFDLPLQLHNLQQEMHELRRENEKLNAKLKDKESLKRELFMEDVLKNAWWLCKILT